MPELLGKITGPESYHEHHAARIHEGRVAIDGLYGVMLAIDADGPVSLMLPALITGVGPFQADQLIIMRMRNREGAAVPVHVSIMDGVFRQFDSGILVPQGQPRPEVHEGYLLRHHEIHQHEQQISQALALNPVER